jgi:nitroreductase
MSNILEDLNWRYAVKRFDSKKKIKDSDFDKILESLRLTPTSYGLQAFKVVQVEDPELRKRLVDASYGQDQVADASHLLILCSYKELQEEHVNAYMERTSAIRNIGIESLDGFAKMIKNVIDRNSEEQNRTWLDKQTYIALGQLLHTCASMRIDALPMEGFDARKFDEILGLSDMNLVATLVCPIGYRHSEDSNQHKTKVRKSINDFAIKM